MIQLRHYHLFSCIDTAFDGSLREQQSLVHVRARLAPAATWTAYTARVPKLKKLNVTSECTLAVSLSQPNSHNTKYTRSAFITAEQSGRVGQIINLLDK
jgi:hypothetical protein